MKIKSIIKQLRPEQWFKNIFVFLPLFFSGQLLNINMLYVCIISFFAFSFAASSIYCFNDIVDVEADRKHPRKSKRPIASGAVSISAAYAMAAVCLLISLSLLFFFGGEAKYTLIGLILFYYVMNIAYCFYLKRIAIVDVMIIAIGFVIRVLVGGAATGIVLSEWIIIMTFLLALFLAFAKRRDDVVIYDSTGVAMRKNTSRYNVEFMNQILSIVAAVTIIAYIMYTVSPEVIARFNSRYVYLTSLFVLAGIIRYLQIVTVESNAGSPTRVLFRDRFIQFCILGWIVSFFIIIYFLNDAKTGGSSL